MVIKLNLIELNPECKTAQFDFIIVPYFPEACELIFCQAEKRLNSSCLKDQVHFKFLIFELLQKRDAIYFAEVSYPLFLFVNLLEAENAANFLSFKKPHHFTGV
jgi:hypothetical protein